MSTNRTFDRVHQAGLESFPASDPPAWGSSHAAHDTAPDDQLPARLVPIWAQRIGLGLAAIGSIVAVIALVRHLRA